MRSFDIANYLQYGTDDLYAVCTGVLDGKSPAITLYRLEGDETAWRAIGSEYPQLRPFPGWDALLAVGAGPASGLPVVLYQDERSVKVALFWCAIDIGHLF